MASISETGAFHPAWLAGMLECAGSINFDKQIDKKTGNVYYHPVIGIGDNSQARMLLLQSITGGYLCKDSGNTWRWRIWGKKALEIAEQIAQFTILKKEVLTAFQNWENTDDRDERAEIVEILKSNTGPDISSESYIPLILNPQFLAGVVDARGMFTHKREFGGEGEDAHDWVMPFLAIISQNIVLLESIVIIYSGKVLDYHSKNSFGWRGNSQESKELARIVDPYLKLRVNEVWK
ncbi:MAG: hypothetical protein UV10_C0027G0002 [Candidatus Azambacteria bacterium GW2011_GWA1_42_19]|uniref:Uncharacterized protein n=1 Tax=Candidatus Azambacteria bacterium GW2011_GWA1_42_19 TaxID=1618609 RepID=A0A0G0Z9E5_9BACT|nr:MAG: hypothetical protein UV10_C0027G0002 [Candidatus Azambacteria bacterium GW2011_GWA1_42_19]